MKAAFRHHHSGRVVETGRFHDISYLPGGELADLGDWEAGFTDADGRFLDRREAASAVGVVGRLEAVSYFDAKPNPTLEAGYLESWVKLGLAGSRGEPVTTRYVR